MTRASSEPVARRQTVTTSGIVRDLALGLLVVLGTSEATWWLVEPAASHVAVALAMYVVVAGVVLGFIPPDAPGPGVGYANRVTLGRAALAIPIGALCLPPTPLDATGSWWVIALATAVLILDGVDGRIARTTGTETRFGARFDMELDAALILALSVLVWADDRVGPWCILIGLMRYLFVAAGRLWPALDGELPESRRRKVVCVVQGVVLLVALGPIIPSGMATMVVAAGLAMLTYSFAVDVRWLLARQR